MINMAGAPEMYMHIRIKHIILKRQYIEPSTYFESKGRIYQEKEGSLCLDCCTKYDFSHNILRVISYGRIKINK